MRDPEGTYIFRELIKACFNSKEKGWTKYQWPNPVTKMGEPKLSYVEKVPGLDVCLGTGIYK